MLDLGCQRQPHRALAPREQVRETPVGDDDVRERMRAKRDVGKGVFVRSGDEVELDQADGLPRLVTGAYRRAPSPLASTRTAWPASARPCGVPTSGTRSAVSRP